MLIHTLAFALDLALYLVALIAGFVHIEKARLPAPAGTSYTCRADESGVLVCTKGSTP